MIENASILPAPARGRPPRDGVAASRLSRAGEPSAPTMASTTTSREFQTKSERSPAKKASTS